MVGRERYVVLHRIVRVPIVGHDLDRAFFDSFLDGNPFNPLLGIQLLCIDLASMDTRRDALFGADRARWHRIVYGDDYIRLDDDRREHGVCFIGPR